MYLAWCACSRLQPSGMSKPSSAPAHDSGSVTLHPLVIINVSDHFTRARCNGGPAGEAAAAAPPRVVGALLGVQVGRRIEIANSFELKCTIGDDGAPLPNFEHLKTRLDQYKKTFPAYDMLGWYSTAQGVQPGDLELHQLLCEREGTSGSLLYLTLDPVLALAAGTRDLPITIYESEVHMVDELPVMRFVQLPYKLDSIESERIAVDHVAHILPTGDSNSGSAFSQHLSTQYTAISMLSERIDVIRRYLEAVSSGRARADHELLRQIKSLAARLPALDTARFDEEAMRDFNNTLLVTYLGSITKGAGTLNEVVDKYNLAYDKHSRRRGIF